MPLRRREALALGTVAVASAVAGFLAGPLFRRLESAGEQALTVAKFQDLEGKSRSISDWKGKVLVVNFWATWCAPCREEIPMFLSAREQYLQFGVEFIGIAIDQAPKVIEYANEAKIAYPLLLADAGGLELMRQLGNRAGGLPYTVLLDRAGSPFHRKLGPLQRSELDSLLGAHLARQATRT